MCYFTGNYSCYLPRDHRWHLVRSILWMRKLRLKEVKQFAHQAPLVINRTARNSVMPGSTSQAPNSWRTATCLALSQLCHMPGTRAPACAPRHPSGTPHPSQPQQARRPLPLPAPRQKSEMNSILNEAEAMPSCPLGWSSFCGGTPENTFFRYFLNQSF